MRVAFMAHPVSGDVRENLKKARAWMRWIEDGNNVVVCANWILECEIWDDADPEQREAGMRRGLAVIERCDEIWLVGPRISEGMRLELEHARKRGLAVVDLTGECNDWPPGSATGSGEKERHVTGR
jgi:hypothetical protein